MVLFRLLTSCSVHIAVEKNLLSWSLTMAMAVRCDKFYSIGTMDLRLSCIFKSKCKEEKIECDKNPMQFFFALAAREAYVHMVNDVICSALAHFCSLAFSFSLSLSPVLNYSV